VKVARSVENYAFTSYPASCCMMRRFRRNTSQYAAVCCNVLHRKRSQWDIARHARSKICIWCEKWL